MTGDKHGGLTDNTLDAVNKPLTVVIRELDKHGPNVPVLVLESREAMELLANRMSQDVLNAQ